MMTTADFARGVTLLGAASLPPWERIAVYVREYAAMLDATDRDWLAKTLAELDRFTSEAFGRTLADAD